MRDDLAIEVAVASREQIETWVRDAAKALSPGGHEHEADDTMPERLARIRHHVVPVTVA